MNMDSGLLPGTSSSSGQVDDSFEDACSICLEPFSFLDPPSVTKCKHEYHLHCILEWSQVRKECPTCLQHLVLKDPASQELLAGVESDKNLRLRFTFNHVNQDNEIHDDASLDDGSDFEQKIIRHFATIVTRARNISIRRRQTTPEIGPSQVLPSVPVTNTSHGTQVDSSSESFKSKITTASIKCKETISNSTRNLKEKLTARNESVKELTRGVQREMNAGIARMKERFDIIQKRDGVSVPLSWGTMETSSSRQDEH
ncbi:hypothetical protein CDL12_10821 [Handroanthus impetiginosus]|uniref:RING-type E3 ubiquitin transferase n=1 Tax=Handroanthus impetiginosus TaxID=429701 RepID=A0A2G9HG71_9LAMI|nr:hypothetical protein CDL12_10821 [Handroanthus impetiginosus]